MPLNLVVTIAYADRAATPADVWQIASAYYGRIDTDQEKED
jgi:hypothetical protein